MRVEVDDLLRSPTEWRVVNAMHCYTGTQRMKLIRFQNILYEIIFSFYKKFVGERVNCWRAEYVHTCGVRARGEDIKFCVQTKRLDCSHFIMKEKYFKCQKKLF